MSITCSAQAMVARLGQMAVAQRAALSGASNVLACNNVLTARALPVAQPIRYHSQKSGDEKQAQRHSLDELKKQIANQNEMVAFYESRYKQEKWDLNRQLDGFAFLGAFLCTLLLDISGPLTLLSALGGRILSYGANPLLFPFLREARDLKEARTVLDAQMKKLQQENRK